MRINLVYCVKYLFCFYKMLLAILFVKIAVNYSLTNLIIMKTFYLKFINWFFPIIKWNK